MSTTPPPPPDLPTLHEPASWRNHRGAVDRSACFAITAKQALGVGNFWSSDTLDEPGGRLSTDVIELEELDLAALRSGQRPRELRGDYRFKAYAMQPDGSRMGSRWERGKARGLRRLNGLRRDAPDGPDHRLSANPNRGACATKVLGLVAGWAQRVRVETWLNADIPPGDPRLPKSKLATGQRLIRRYLVCPCSEPTDSIRGLRVGEDGVIEAAGLSRRPRGEGPVAGNGPAACIERATKLYLPLCTQREFWDAVRAAAWLESVSSTTRNPRTQSVGFLLVARYAELLPPRALRCSRCLGMRWGRINVKQLPPEVRHLFPTGRAPELPDPYALNRLGHQFAHDQLREPLPGSALKNRRTRGAALDRGAEPQDADPGSAAPTATEWEQRLTEVWASLERG